MKVKSFALSLACAFSFSAASVMADPVWTGEALYRGSEPALATDNLLRTVGVTYSIKDNGQTLNSALSDDRCLSNGCLDWNTDGNQKKSCIIGNNAKLEVVFPRATDVTAIKIYSCSGSRDGGRDGIHVASISVKRTADGEWESLTSISDYSIGLNDNSSAGAYFVSLTDTTGKIAEGVFALLIDFGTMDNNGTFMDEIEVCGTLAEASSFHVVFLDLDGTTELKAVDLNPGEGVTAPDVPTHEGWTFLGWDKDFSVVNDNLTIRSLWAEAGKPLWTTGTWADGVVPASYNSRMLSWNLLTQPGAQIVEVANRAASDGEAVGRRDPAVLTNGVLACGIYAQGLFVVGDNAILDFELAEPSTIRDLHVFSSWANGGRDAFEIAGVYVRPKGAAEFVPVNKFNAVKTGGFNDNGSGPNIYAYLACADGSDLAGLSEAVRIVFRETDNKHIGLSEIAISGVPESTIIPASQVVLNGRGRANESDVETPSEGCQNLHEHLKNLTVETNQPSDSVSSLNNASVLIDGAYPFSSSVKGAYGVGDNAVLAFDFVRPVDLKTINFYSWWSDTGRNGMGIAGLYVRRAGKTEYRRVKMDFASYDGPDCGLVASLTVATDGWLAEGVDSVRIVFDKADNNGTACQEIEFFGRKAAKRGFKLIVR